MGSINCKEYVTATANNDSCANQTGNGTYQSTLERETNTTTTMTTNMATDEYTDPVTVCNSTDINDNEMKQLEFDQNTKILLIKQNGRFTAIGNKCSHYGAPLHTGALGEGRVRCPWHGACFNAETGDIEDFPGLDSIPCYKVTVEQSGEVRVRAKRKDLENNKRLKDMVKRNEKNESTCVIVGGGPAGAVCAETLRQEGFDGRIVMLCREPNLPYDRVKLTKAMDIDMAKIQFRPMDFYNEHGIEVMLNTAATAVDTVKETVSYANTEIHYDKLFIATGGRPYTGAVVGSELGNVFTVRDYTDVQNIYNTLKPEMNVVCYGASFIALESAAYLVNKVKSVTLVGLRDVPLKKAFGDEVGARVLKLFQDNGVNMLMENKLNQIVGDENGYVKEVMLKDESTIPCDLVILGNGTTCYTEFLKDSGIEINKDGSINTDHNLRTNINNIYVGGDIANAPVYCKANERATIGHYQLAQYHGRVAAINMVGQRNMELRAVPFFFTMFFGKGIRYAGHGKYETIHIEGDLENLKFVAYYMDAHERVVAVASCGRDPIVAKYAELLSQGKTLYRVDIIGKEDPEDWTKKLFIPKYPC